MKVNIISNTTSYMPTKGKIFLSLHKITIKIYESYKIGKI